MSPASAFKKNTAAELRQKIFLEFVSDRHTAGKEVFVTLYLTRFTDMLPVGSQFTFSLLHGKLPRYCLVSFYILYT